MLQTILEKANSVLASLKEHGGKYATIALVAALALVWSYRRIRKEVDRNYLIGSSLLHLSPRNVRLPGPLAGPAGSQGATSLPGTAPIPASQPYVPPEGSVTITPRDPSKTLDEVVTVKYKTWGLTLEPGLDFAAAPFGMGLDVKWLYYKKFGIETGALYFADPFNKYSASLSASYRLDYYSLLKNTEFVVGYASNSPILGWVGIRINF